MKQCSRCGETKSLDAFSPHPTGALGVRPDCRPCRAAYNREWRKANAEKVREINHLAGKKWYAANRDRKRAASLKWRRDNPEKYKAMYERLNAKRAAEIADDPETFRAARRAAYATNPEPAKEHAARRKARLLRADAEWVDYAAIILRDQGHCGICGEPIMGPLHFDHIIPLAAGGTHESSNVQLAHARCNLRKYTKVNWTPAEAA